MDEKASYTIFSVGGIVRAGRNTQSFRSNHGAIAHVPSIMRLSNPNALRLKSGRIPEMSLATTSFSLDRQRMSGC
jgi:hypothetical protein